MKQIRESKFSKIVAYYLIITMVLQVIAPMQMYALTSGPTQPEFNSFTPIGTSDMVDLASGDFNYNIPIMDVGGYPLNLAYNSGVTMDQEASWVGLGWDLSVGQIARQVRGLPDDFNGDKMIYENNMKPNTTIGSNVNVFLAPFGANEVKASFGVGIKYNNYDGVGFTTNGGLTYDIGNNLSVGMSLESSSTDGVTASPSVSLHAKHTDKKDKDNNLSLNLGVGLNSRKGVETMTMSASRTRVNEASKKGGAVDADGKVDRGTSGSSSSGSIGGSVSFNDASFTPSKRVGMSSKNIMFALNVEGAVYGVDPGAKFAGYANTQGIKSSEKYKIERAFGYENTTNAGVSDVLDFNREKDRTVNKNTVSLPVTNYTHDIYSVQGQGVGGMFRPYRGQVGFVYDNYTQDDSNGLNLGGEIGAGAGTHFGGDGAFTDSKSSSGLWINTALNRVKEKRTGNKPNYEKVFFKNIGGNHVDKDMKKLFYDGTNPTKLGGYEPISFKIGGGNYSRDTELLYYDKFLNTPLAMGSEPYIKRGDNRLNRGQTIQKITREEAYKFGTRTFSPFTNKKTHKNHTSEIRIIKEGGDRYNFARAAYNVTKKEVTFDISGKAPDCDKGTVSYTPGVDNSAGNNREGDQYFNRITTPAFAHTYLLTSVLSSDYQDTDKVKGPSDGDLGNYTAFSYVNKGQGADGKYNTYKWRVPYAENKANFDEGLKSLNKDNKANYQYGEKELLYIKKIETKTHVAIFTISSRKDGYGVKGENGGMDTSESSKMWKLDKISLYSKPEYLAHKDDLENAIPIKVAHFEYDYSLCPGVENNSGEPAVGPVEQNNQGGKLTLKKIYFTYRNSNMGKYTPYEFNYDQETNYPYDQRAYDIWGYYKPNTGAGCNNEDPLSNAEYPYVDQSSKVNADKYASAWLLKSIELPSGGEMELNYESDDYKHVQNRDTMQMFKVVGTGDNSNPSQESVVLNKELFNGNQENEYLYIKLANPSTNVNNEFFNKYIKKVINQPIYFRFLLNMTKPSLSNKADYVTGYVELSQNVNDHRVIDNYGDGLYAAVRIKTVSRGDGAFGSQVNPIAKAGWYFGRQNLSNVMYNLTGDEGLDITNVKGVVLSLLNLVPQIVQIFRSPNGQLIDKKIASRFVKDKAWIRLMSPENKKLGGGSRVKEIKIKDSWDVMTHHNGDEVYAQFYGQQYSYTNEDGTTSSGVATYEPLGGKENPFVEPFYDRAHKETLLGGDVQNYVEMPFGECFFPSPKVTYSRVTVKNLPREKTNANDEVITVKKHATGHVVSEFFTSKDYPTVSDLTKISSEYDHSDLAGLLNINVKTHLSLSQGFSIHTNDMDGKPKSQWVFAEGQKNPISGMEYKYEKLSSTQDNRGKLNNEVITIDSEGNISKNIVGVDYDVINDFRLNESITETAGIQFNTEGLPLAFVFLIVPIPIPSYAKHENILKSAVTTKVIHSTGILRETVAYDLGSKVSTKNLAWDANTGDVLVTETVNEYNDNYYSFNFPAYWAYDGMNQSALNIGLEWNIKDISGQNKYQFDSINSVNPDADDYLIDGDEVWITPTLPAAVKGKGFKAWVVNVKGDSFDLIDEKGIKINNVIDEENKPLVKVVATGKIKVIKSGHKNMATSSMASVTLMKNPLEISPNVPKLNIGLTPFLSSIWSENRIVNASAIEYKDVWTSQCECGLPQMRFNSDGTLKFEYMQNSTDDFDIVEKRSYNPYIYNVLGNWRAVSSYAYLTGRNKEADPTPRKTGFFKDYSPFYIYNGTNWTKSADAYQKWTFASEVTQYNPFGQEVENRDALKRYSSALYGYNNRFPIAVASNTQYKELAYDGFEDYDFANCEEKSHFSYQSGLQQNKVSITNKESHTGRKSIRLEPTTKTVIRKKIVNCPAPQGTKKVASTNKKVVKK
ncbi:MAG: hypothetical protein V4670_06215 [Bacteroidota bacterium]